MLFWVSMYALYSSPARKLLIPKVGALVGYLLGGVVSPISVGEDVDGCFDGREVGNAVGWLEDGREVGCAEG